MEFIRNLFSSRSLLLVVLILPVLALSGSVVEETLYERVEVYSREYAPTWEGEHLLEFWVKCSNLPDDLDKVALYKSIILQESGYNPRAVSYVGAKGLGQFMPNTWDWVSNKIWGVDVDVFSPEHNIRATIYYFEWLFSQWHSPRPLGDRVALTLASYNAGLGNILKAQELAKGSLRYQDIENELHRVTGKHAKETKDYVARVLANYEFFTKQKLYVEEVNEE